MVSERKSLSSRFGVLLFVSGLSALGTGWLMSGNVSDEAIAFRAKEARYQNQIESLKLALISNSTEFDRERGLAARLQRELGDANRQINDLARQLAEAQRTISRHTGRLKDARLKQWQTEAGASDRSQYARMETTSALIVSRATSQLGLAMRPETADRHVSRYSPSRRKQAKAMKQQRRRTVALVRRRALTPNVRVSGLGPKAVAREAHQAQAWPLSQVAVPRQDRSVVASTNDRLDFGLIAPSIEVQPKLVRSKLRRANTLRRRTETVRRRQVRRARFARYSRLGRLKSKRSRRGVRQRKSRMSSFKRKVFGFN